MFPLGSPLLPGGVLPLHVFEPRYRQMVIDCLQADGEPEFGQALITHGREAGGGDQRSMIGTLARMVNIEALDEGRYALIAVGMQRIRVNAWLPDDPYPLADVDPWPEEDADVDGLDKRVAGALDRVRSTLALAAELGEFDADAGDLEIADAPGVATYHLGTLAPIGAADRYRLLAAPGPTARLDELDSILDDVDAMLRFRLS